MALAHTILLLLSERSCSGYDLSKEFDSCIGHYWQATPQQIYRELSKMEKQDWVVAETIPQEGRPNKKQYTVTEAGRQTLLEWLAEPSDPMAIREELLVKIRGGHLLEPEIILTELRRRLAEHQEKLDYLLGVEAEHYPEPDELTGSPLMIYLTMRCGIRYQTAWVEWCREAIARLERVATGKASDRNSSSTGVSLDDARLRNPTAAAPFD